METENIKWRAFQLFLADMAIGLLVCALLLYGISGRDERIASLAAGIKCCEEQGSSLDVDAEW